MIRLLAMAGSARRDSLNKRLAAQAARDAEAAGARVTLVDLADYDLPLYDGDGETADGIPEASERLYGLMREHDGLILACPEYNSSITPLLKNTIDWLSRPREGDAPLAAFQGKTAALLAASPGALGGLRGLVHVRAILGNIGVIVIPDQVALPSAHEAFAPDGTITVESSAQRVRSAMQSIVRITERLAG